MANIVRGVMIDLRGQTSLSIAKSEDGAVVLAMNADSVSGTIHLTADQAAALARALLREPQPAAAPLLPVGARVVASAARVPEACDLPGTITETCAGSPLPCRVLFDGWDRPLWCRAEDVREAPKAQATETVARDGDPA